MTQTTNSPNSELSPQRRAALARKGQILYVKSCGTRGGASCCESFAVHQLRLGNVVVVQELLQFLESELGRLRSHDPGGLIPRTEALVLRLRGHLQNEA
jgi:hypothetical protein